MRDIVTKDFGWKVFSVLLALAIWATIKTISSETPTEDRAPRQPEWATKSFVSLPVFVVSAAADVREFRVRPSVVDVTVSGPVGVLGRLVGKEIHVTVDLTDIEAARGLLQRVEVSVPPGLTFVSATPEEVSVVVPSRRISPP